MARIGTDKRDSTCCCLGARSQAEKRTMTLVASMQQRFRCFRLYAKGYNGSAHGQRFSFFGDIKENVPKILLSYDKKYKKIPKIL